MNLRFSLARTYDYLPDLFDKLTPPEGIDRQLLIDTILDEYGTMAMAYPIERMKDAIGRWSIRRQYFMQNEYRSITFEYNPIENTDKYEEITDTTVGSASNNTTGTTSGSSTDKSSSAGYDTANLKQDAQNENTGSSESSATSNGTHETTFTHTNHTHGNIGVTTTQELLTAERECVTFDLYKTIANRFALDMLINIFM